MQVLLVIHHQVSHEAVQLFDAALAKIAGGAEILVPRAAGGAASVRAGVAHHGCDKIAATNARDREAGFHDFT